MQASFVTFGHSEGCSDVSGAWERVWSAEHLIANITDCYWLLIMCIYRCFFFSPSWTSHLHCRTLQEKRGGAQVDWHQASTDMYAMSERTWHPTSRQRWTWNAYTQTATCENNTYTKKLNKVPCSLSELKHSSVQQLANCTEFCILQLRS